MDYKNVMVTWMKEGTLSLPVLLLKNYSKLGLSETEFICLLQVYSDVEQGNHFPTPEEISNRMNISVKECSTILRKLLQQHFLTIEENQSSNGILFESYSFISLWEKLADFVMQESKRAQLQKSLEQEADVYTIFEQEFGRPLSPIECETLAMWLDQDQHSTTIIKAALRESVISGKLNFRYIDRILFEWKKNGVKTIEDARQYGQKFRTHQKTQPGGTTQPSANRKPVPFYNWLEQD